MQLLLLHWPAPWTFENYPVPLPRKRSARVVGGEMGAPLARQPGCHLGCDEPDSVHVLDVDAVLQAIARELHANQIRHRREKNALGSPDGRRKVGHRFRVLGPQPSL